MSLDGDFPGIRHIASGLDLGLIIETGKCLFLSRIKILKSVRISLFNIQVNSSKGLNIN